MRITRTHTSDVRITLGAVNRCGSTALEEPAKPWSGYVYSRWRGTHVRVESKRTIRGTKTLLIKIWGAAMTLTELAAERVRQGKLPDLRYCRTYGGPSVGRACALCAKSIPKQATEIEVIATANSAVSFFVHVDCFAAWSRVSTPD